MDYLFVTQSATISSPKAKTHKKAPVSQKITYCEIHFALMAKPCRRSSVMMHFAYKNT